MSVADLFKNFLPSAATPAAPAAPTPGNIPNSQAVQGATVSNDATAPNGVIPAVSAPAQKTPESVLETFKDIWNNDPNANSQGQPLFNTSQEKLLELARKQDFSATATPERLAAIQAGGEAGMKAMIEMMNEMSQNAYAQSAFATTKLIEGALAKSGFATTQDVQTTLKRTTVSEKLNAANPILNHPATAPMVNAIRDQMIKKYPNATTAELTEMAQEFVLNFASAAQGKPVETVDPRAPKDEDWGKFFS